MTMVEETPVFGFYEVAPNVLEEFAGKKLVDLIKAINDETLIQWDEDKEHLNLILVPAKKNKRSRIKSLVGLYFNLLGLVDGVEVENAFAWNDHEHEEGG